MDGNVKDNQVGTVPDGLCCGGPGRFCPQACCDTCPLFALFSMTQDAWCIQERLAGQDMAMFGVFDGHGMEGKTVSHNICANLPTLLAKHSACQVRPPWRLGKLTHISQVINIQCC